jgi:Holliday junction resolvase
MSRGSDVERQLAKRLSDAGYAVMRAPASGGATDRELPDLLWAKPDTPLSVMELKYTGENVAYYDADEVQALGWFAACVGAKQFLCARYKQDRTYYLCHPNDARRTDSGRYAVDRDNDDLVKLEP